MFANACWHEQKPEFNQTAQLETTPCHQSARTALPRTINPSNHMLAPKQYTPIHQLLTLTVRSCAALALLALIAVPTQAGTIWWDPVPATPGPGDASGSWSTAASNTNWWDGAQNVTWNNANSDLAVVGNNTNTALTI